MNAIRSSSLMRAMILGGAFGWSAAAIAQEKPGQPQPTPPTAAPAGPGATAPPAAGKPASGNPSLDDLLGIGGEPKASEGGKAKPEAGAKPQADDAAAKEHEKALKDELSDAQIADAFTQAVDKMAISARLLDTQFDAGVGTQRVQEDIIAKLNALLDAARKKPSNSKSASSSSNPSQSSNPSSNPTAAKKSDKAMNPGDKRNDKPQDSQEGDPPPFQQGDTNVVLEETRAEWGSLPQRVRDMLLQGRKDKFSAIYQQMTQEYYKRLAEEGTP